MKASAAIVLATAVLAGCPSKDNASSSGAASPPSGTNAAAVGTGPLANLESSPFVNEVWQSQEGQQLPMIYWTRENVRISAQCRNGAGQLSCDALRQIRGGMPVEIAKRTLTGNISAGTRACTKLGHTLVGGRNSVGAEDGFCRFPDGSLLSTGALEQYGMRVVE